MTSSGDALSVSGVCASYDRHAVLHGVSLDVRPGEFASLLGANGAGKTTLLNCIAGLHSSWTGDIRLGDKSLRGLRCFQIADGGVCYVPEGRALVAAHSRRRGRCRGACRDAGPRMVEQSTATVGGAAVRGRA